MDINKTTSTTSTLSLDGSFLEASSPMLATRPSVFMKHYLVNGELREWTGKIAEVHTPILLQGEQPNTPIGCFPMLTKEVSMAALDAAVKAYDNGRGLWPTSSVSFRIAALERFLEGLKNKRDEIANILMWEICKTQPDAVKEVDRTIKYIKDTIHALKTLENAQSTFVHDGGIVAQIRRAPYGVVLCVGPFNYPFNETYTTLIPALIMGNTVIMKLPRCGVLCHAPTLELFRDCFPPGVVNVIGGAGRETMPPLMASGRIDILAFIGTSKAADALQQAHPKPHRLRVCLGLEAKNPAIICADANLDIAVKETVAGALGFNGQRCTALKIVFVHESIAQPFLQQLCAAIDALPMKLPWEKDAFITPLPEPDKPEFCRLLIEDAVAQGAKVINTRGGLIDRTFVAPTVVFPVTPAMRLYHEEQFGPVVPVRTWSDPSEIFEYMASSPYGQQASVFTRDAKALGQMIDVLVNQVSRVNINTMCQRGPDTIPFTGRKDSAYGTLSISDALRVFSMRTVVAAKEASEGGSELIASVVGQHSSNALRMDYLF